MSGEEEVRYYGVTLVFYKDTKLILRDISFTNYESLLQNAVNAFNIANSNDIALDITNRRNGIDILITPEVYDKLIRGEYSEDFEDIYVRVNVSRSTHAGGAHKNYKKAVSKKAVSKKSLSKKAVSKKSLSKKTVSKKSLSKKAVSKKSVSKKGSRKNQ